MKPLTKLSLAAALALGLASPAAAQDVGAPSGTYLLENTHASIIWSVKHLGLSDYQARFDTFDATLELDVENPANSSITATIDPTSVSTNYPGEKDFNAEISNDARFLNADAHPTITFASKSVTPTGPDTATIVGDLTMLGATHEVTLEATLNGALEAHPFAKRPAVGFTAVGSLDRTVYGMDFLAPQVVSPEVEFVINAEFLKAE